MSGTATTTIDLNRTSSQLRRDLLQQPGAGLFTACFACRTCSSGCPVAAVDHRFDPAKIVRMVLYGLREEILEGGLIWLCTSCYTCQENCPQGVRITDLITLLKNMAFQAGHMPAGVRAQQEIVKQEGRIYPLDDFDNKKRQKVCLPPLPTRCEGVRDLFPEL